MKENNSSRIETWLDSRLGKIREEGKQISTEQILIELRTIFKMEITKKNERAMKAKVRKIRNRIYKRHERKKLFCKELAHELILPVELIERWIRCGLIIPSADQRDRHLKLFREFEYYRRFKPEIIPQNIEIPIWAD